MGLEQWAVYAQIASAIGTVLSALGTVVLAIMVFRQVSEARKQATAASDSVEEMRKNRRAQERPQVIVDADFSRPFYIYVAIRNIGKGAARNVTFDFSADLISSLSEDEHSTYTPLNQRSFFREGIKFLAPGAEIKYFWDGASELTPLLREKGPEEGFTVTSKYEDLEGETYETLWVLDPLPIAERAHVEEKGLPDLANSAEEIGNTLQDILCSLEARGIPVVGKALLNVGDDEARIPRSVRHMSIQ